MLIHAVIIHGAIVAATVAAAATIIPTGCGDDRLVYTPYKTPRIDCRANYSSFHRNK